jgi:hypothetical protein
LCITDALPGGGTHLSPFAFWNFRRSGWLGTATEEHGPEFGNLSVDVPLPFLEAENGGGNDLGCQFCWHVNLSRLTRYVVTIVHRRAYRPSRISAIVASECPAISAAREALLQIKAAFDDRCADRIHVVL